MNAPKIFCIGFHKTGTTSLGLALEMLGYDVCGYIGLTGNHLQRDIERVCFAAVPEFDAFQDLPWPLLYRQLDEQFPGSRFILTTRESPAWLRSCVKHFAGTNNALHRWIYGDPDPLGHEDQWIARYEKHNREVMDYFARRDDLLHLELGEAASWQKLCGFLNQPMPDAAYPHANTAASRVRQTPLKQKITRLFGLGKAA